MYKCSKSLVMWDRGLRVRNVKFINFQNNSTQAIFGPIITGRCMIGCGGSVIKVSNEFIVEIIYFYVD